MLKNFTIYKKPLSALTDSKLLINTLNAHSYNVTQKDKVFSEALQKSDVLIPDGISVVYALRWLTGEKLNKVAGADLFFFEMNRLQLISGSCFFLGSSEAILHKIKERASREYPNINIYSYSPPFKAEFSAEENKVMINSINAVKPDVLFVGMTAPKQEKWAYKHFDELKVGHVCCIGAVFDFYAGTVSRAPQWMINIGLEWLYRLIKEPKRMWKRYLIGNVKFVWYVLKEKMTSKEKK